MKSRQHTSQFCRIAYYNAALAGVCSRKPSKEVSYGNGAGREYKMLHIVLVWHGYTDGRSVVLHPKRKSRKRVRKWNRPAIMQLCYL